MRIVDLGRTGFLEAYNIQLALVKKISQGLEENTLIITEHNPVITIGRKGTFSNIFKTKEYLASRGIEVISADRGGDVTYHGPGQVVAYPVFKLENEAKDIHNFLRYLEKVGSQFIGQYGIASEVKPGFRGVWIDGKKIGSIGIAVKKWVSYHGIAMNINIGLEPFSFIRPCGIEDVEMASLNKLLGRDLDIYDAKNKLISAFKEVPLLAEAVCKV